MGALLALALAVVGVGGWWGHNNSPEARAYANHSGVDATADSYGEDVETADCSHDCNGQEAGWAWARQHSIAGSIDCPNNANPAFREGCQAYADTYNAAHDAALSDVDDD